jgi:hypothetical protein
MPTVNVGDDVSVIAYDVSSKPKWLKWTTGANLAGKAQTPSGHRRLVILDGVNQRQQSDYYVNPIYAGGFSEAEWRLVIYRPDGAYVISTGQLGDLPTIGTPQVRLSVNAPSKAVVRLPASRTPSVKWSDGQTGLIERGMEMTVEFRDAYTKALSFVFRGMIYQVESGETITITAYDRLMDLVQYSDQYQSHAGYTQPDTSSSRTASGSNYVYQMTNNVGTLITANPIDILQIDASMDQSHSDQTHVFSKYIVHPLPKVNTGGVDYTPEQGRKITNLKVNAFSYLSGYKVSGTASSYAIQYCSVTFYLYQMVNGTLELREFASGGSWQTTITAAETKTATPEISKDVDWTITGDPSTYYVGIYIGFYALGIGWSITQNAYADYTASKLTFTGDFYISDNGSSWSVGSGDHPEIAVKFEHYGASLATNLFSVSGSTITIAQSSIPATPLDTYISNVDKGIAMVITYFISGAAGIQGLVEDLLSWAGLTPDVIQENMGQTDYYTTSTYDYMTCLLELLKAGNYGVMASINEPGKAIVRRRHRTSETPVINVTTDPSETSYEQLVLSHDLTAHWASEKATQAYIAENATSSGLPIALETDDALMDNSLTEIMQSPLRSIIADNTLGTHDLLANAAGGKMVALHTNVFEGKMTLAGYHVELWDMSTSYIGGQPFSIRVPEYGANGMAIPTEIILGDGVTQVSLDNIRTADRSEVANSMGLSADAISNNASTIPSSVYVFGRLSYSEKVPSANSLTSIVLFNEDSTWAQQSDPTYLRLVRDNVGYVHALGVFPASDQPGGYAPTSPINRVFLQIDGSVQAVCIDNAKYAYGGQNIHVDIRFESSS